VVLITSVVDLAGAQLLRDALRSLSRQHRPLLVHLEDPDIARLGRAVPETAAEAYAKVSALEILLGNRALSARLRHAGIETVSTSSDRLALDALDLYLASLRGASRGRRRRASSSAARPPGVAAPLPRISSGV